MGRRKLRTALTMLTVLFWSVFSGIATAAPQQARAFSPGDTVKLPATGQMLTADDVQAFDFWLSMPAGKTSETLLTLSDGVETLKVMSDGKTLSFEVTDMRGQVVTYPSGLTLGTAVHHLALDINSATVALWLDGVAQKTVLGAGFSALSGDTAVTLTLGSADFNGGIGAFRLYNLTLDDQDVTASMSAPDDFVPTGIDSSTLVVAQRPDGTFDRPTAAVVGLWHESGATSGSLAKPKVLPDIIDPTHHGQFQNDQIFYALSKEGTGFRMVDSRGYWRALKPVAGDHERFTLHDETGIDVGEVKFRPGGTELTVTRVSDAFLIAGKRFKYLDLPNDTNATQTFGEAWIGLAKPKGFRFSTLGCFDTRRMGLENFSENGCARGFFREPPPDTHRYSDGGGNLVIPWGWAYALLPQAEGGSYSTLATSSGEVGKSVTGGSGFDFDVLGAKISHNKQVETVTKSLVQREVSRSYQTFTDRKHSLIVDAKLMRLDQCFIKDVMRASFGLTGVVPEGPMGFNRADNDNGACDQSLDDPIKPAELLERYGNHYAYAITYGARMMGWAEMSSTALNSLSSKSVNVSDGIGFHLEGSLNLPSKAGSVNVKAAGNANQSNGQKDWNETQSKINLDTQNYVCFGGGGCSSSGVNGSDDPIPIYLDLRPMTQLLGPPYFLDPAITVDLRAQVQKAFDAIDNQDVPDVPLVQILDAKVLDAKCTANALGTPSSALVKQSDAALGPFAPGGPFANDPALIWESPVVYSPKDGAAFMAELCERYAFGRATIQAVGSADGKLINVGASDDIATLKKTQKPFTLMTPFLPKTLDAQGRSTYRFNYRLREKHDALNPTCLDPCPFYVASVDGTLDVSVDINAGRFQTGGATYPLYPQFSAQDPVAYTAQPSRVDVVVGRGVLNYKNSAFKLIPLEYQMDLTLDITARDLQKTLGFASGNGRRLPLCKGRAPDFTKLTGIGGNAGHAYFYTSDAEIFAYDKAVRCFVEGPLPMADSEGLEIFAPAIAGMLDWSDENGHQYMFLRDGRYRIFDADNQQPISGVGWAPGGFTGLSGYQDKIVAATNDPNLRKTYFFLNDGNVMRFDNASDKIDAGPTPITKDWPGAKTQGLIGVADFSKRDSAMYLFYADGSFQTFSLTDEKVIRTAQAARVWK